MHRSSATSLKKLGPVSNGGGDDVFVVVAYGCDWMINWVMDWLIVNWLIKWRMFWRLVQHSDRFVLWRGCWVLQLRLVAFWFIVNFVGGRLVFGSLMMMMLVWTCSHQVDNEWTSLHSPFKWWRFGYGCDWLIGDGVMSGRLVEHSFCYYLQSCCEWGCCWLLGFRLVAFGLCYSSSVQFVILWS